MRKPVFGVSDQVGYKLGCTVTEDGKSLEILDLEVEGLYYLRSGKKALISCTLSTQLICTFVFEFAKSRFSHDWAHMIVCDISFQTQDFETDHLCGLQ